MPLDYAFSVDEMFDSGYRKAKRTRICCGESVCMNKKSLLHYPVMMD